MLKLAALSKLEVTKSRQTDQVENGSNEQLFKPIGAQIEHGLGLIRLKKAFESENLLIPDLNGVERSMVAYRPHWWGDDV